MYIHTYFVYTVCSYCILCTLCYILYTPYYILLLLRSLLLLLRPLKHINKNIRLLRPLDNILSIDRIMRHASDKLDLRRLSRLLIDLWTTLVTIQPSLCLALRDTPSPHSSFQQHRLIRDIPLLLKIRAEQLQHDFRLYLRTILFPREVDQTMRVARAARLPAKLELDPLLCPRGRETRKDGVHAPRSAEFLLVVRPLVHAGVCRSVRVKVVCVPGQGESVVGVLLAVECDGFGEAAVADVAPLVDVISMKYEYVRTV